MSTIEQIGSLKGSILRGTSLSGNVKSEAALRGKAGGSTSNDYEKLMNLPSIEGISLKGNKSFEDLGLKEATNIDIDNMFKSIFK